MRKAYLKDDRFPSVCETLENEARHSLVSANTIFRVGVLGIIVTALLLAGTVSAWAATDTESRNPIPIYSIAQPDWPLWQQPSTKSAHRGALAQGVRVPLFAMAEGSDCKNPWWQIGADAWLCPDAATITQLSGSESAATQSSNELIGYVAVGKQGTLGYRRLEDVDVGSPSGELQAGFMLGIKEASKDGDSAALFTTHGLWIPARDVQAIRPSSFKGAEVTGDLEIAWVFDKRSPLHSAPDVRQRPPAFLERLAQVTITGQQQKPSGLWFRTEQGWLKSTDVRVPELQPPPEGIGTDEHWLDVDIKSQTLVAYVGARPVFATLVSTGRGKPGSELATPVGLHRIWIKLRRSDMDNLDDADNHSPYAVEAVPHVMFFDRGYGIHGTYWHDGFGVPKSHGCVNVSLSDAAWLFAFASPHLPVGWSAVFPTARESGTLVRIR
jgi:lipoprotein-anchoring transpeptidase ErfK/SrfK